jgi:hypothetical protein
MMLKKNLFTLIFIYVLCSCEHRVTYDEYLINRSSDDIIVYIPTDTYPFNKIQKDSVIIKKNHHYKLLEYGKLNGYEIEFSECNYYHNFHQNDSLLSIKKLNDTIKSYTLNNRLNWYFEKVGKKFKNIDCKCTYVIREQDFE